MAVSWGFAMLLVLTLVALITFSQPLFQSEAVLGHTQSDMKRAPEGVIARGVPLQILLTSKLIETQKCLALPWPCPADTPSWVPRQRWTRKLIQRNPSPPGEEQPLRQVHAKSHTPRRSVLATFQSDRMVPTGPNPLHNSNRSQVIFP